MPPRALSIALALSVAAVWPPASGGAFTTERRDAEAYLQPAPGLSLEQTKLFERGRRGFEGRWVVFPSLDGEWGLGPLFIAERCSDCHVRAGRGALPSEPEAQLRQGIVRISVPGEEGNAVPRPHPAYGDQFQNRGLTGEDPRAHGYGERVRPEGAVHIVWHEREVILPDGETVTLRRPEPRFEALRFGPLGPEAQLSLRNAQPIFGLGLLEAVPEESLLAVAERQRARGIEGRPNRVPDHASGKAALGRFGWKANQPSIRQQTAAAFNGDIGVTSSLYPEESCTAVQRDCLAQPPGNVPEVLDQDLDALEFWTLALAVPAQRDADHPEVQRGRDLFARAQCDLCHVPELETGPHTKLPQLAGLTIRPYSDLLLHDMGEGLADGRPDFEAGPRDWRTQPLWGLGLAATVGGQLALLHDGRARSILEAILWHGGEAAAARDAFMAMPKAERDALIRFLESL